MLPVARVDGDGEGIAEESQNGEDGNGEGVDWEGREGELVMEGAGG